MVLGGARSGKSAFAEGLARDLGGKDVLYVATARTQGADPELLQRVEAHRKRRDPAWGLLELSSGDLEPVLRAAKGRGAVLLDSLTLWVSARSSDHGTLREFEHFLGGVGALNTPVVLVSDEVGLGVVPGGVETRRFRDVLGLVNQKAAAAAGEAYLCFAGIPCRIK